MSGDGNNKLPRAFTSNSIAKIYDNEISGNEVHGDLNIGSTVIKLPKFNLSVGAESLRKLIDEHEKLKEDSPIYLYVIEELQCKINNRKDREIIGLESKLISANRAVFLDEALVSSQKAAKMILRFENIKSYQIIFNHVLSLIVTRFRSYIVPLINKNVDDLTIRVSINSIIIEPLYQEVSLVGGYITTDLLEGMMFFLTEKCHLEWK